MPGVCAVLGSSWSPGITLTPCVFQSIGSCRCCSLISVRPSVLCFTPIWSLRSAKGVHEEARGSRPDLEFRFSARGGGLTSVFFLQCMEAIGVQNIHLNGD